MAPLSATSSTNTLSLSGESRKTVVIGNRVFPFEAFVTPVDCEKVSGKKTLPPLDAVHSKKTQSFIANALHWRSSKKNRPKKNRPKHIIVKKPVSNDNTSQNNVEKKICLEPEPMLIMVAEAPIENRVPFQSTSQSTSSSQEICVVPNPTLIKVAPEPVTKRVRFQLPPTIKIIPSRNILDPLPLSEALSDFPSHSWAVRQFVLNSNRTAVPKQHQAKDIQKPRETREVLERPRGAHHARVRSRTTNVQEYIPYDQECDADSEDEGGKVTGLPRPRTRRGKRNSEIGQ